MTQNSGSYGSMASQIPYWMMVVLKIITKQNIKYNKKSDNHPRGNRNMPPNYTITATPYMGKKNIIQTSLSLPITTTNIIITILEKAFKVHDGISKVLSLCNLIFFSITIFM